MASASDRLITAAPFIAALLMAGLAPMFSKLVRERVISFVSWSDRALGEEVDGVVSPHRSNEYIGDYSDYAVDAAQAVATVVLPLIGIGVSVNLGVSKGLGFVVAVGLLVIALVAFGKVLLTDPVKYAARRWHGFTRVPLLGVAINLVCGLIVVVAI